MAEFFQARKSDPPTYHEPTEYPKHMYGGHPVNSDEEVKAGLINGRIKTRLVNNPEEQEALLKKGWVVDLKDLIEEPEVTVSPDPDDMEFEIVRRRRRDAPAPAGEFPDDVPTAASDDGDSKPRRGRIKP